MGDPTLVTQVFQNLLGNALKYRRPDVRPELTLSVERSGDMWVVGVRDNGIGISMEHADQVFQPFKRLHSRDKFEGTGIGLAICRKAVERMGGRIWLEAAPGQGAHFKFTLPVEVDSLEEAVVG
jgi:signal transduction histidine kinase